MILYNFPNDVVLIVYKYLHRFNYNKCIEEYIHIYVPHWDDKQCIFKSCYLANSYDKCPLDDEHCPHFMDRTNNNFGIRHLIRTKMKAYDYLIPLPKNYLNKRL